MRTSIRNLGVGGMVRDIPPYDLQPHQLTSAVNVEFRDGAIERAWGLTREHIIPDNAVWMEAWYANNNGRILVVAEDEYQVVFYEIAGSTVSDISNEYDIVSPGARWDSTVFGLNAILTNGSGAPFVRGVEDGGPIERMGQWPDGWAADMIRTYRNFLVALRVTKDGYYDETRVQWSNAAPNNGLPPDWDELDPASLAGGVSFASDTGPLQDAAVLGQSLILYTQRAAIAMALGGATVMTFRPVLNMGLLSRGCVVPFDTFHFCVGNGSIFTHDGSTVKYPADDITNTDFYRDLADPSDVRLAHDEARRTIEIFYKNSTEIDYPNRVLRWNYKNNTWTFNDYENVGLVRAKFAPDSQRVVTWDTIDELIGGGPPPVRALIVQSVSPSDANDQGFLYSFGSPSGMTLGMGMPPFALDSPTVAELYPEWDYSSPLFPGDVSHPEMYISVAPSFTTEFHVRVALPDGLTADSWSVSDGSDEDLFISSLDTGAAEGEPELVFAVTMIPDNGPQTGEIQVTASVGGTEYTTTIYFGFTIFAS